MGNSLTAARDAERARYTTAYARENYRMGQRRMADAVRDLAALPCRGSYLDVSCGRGEMLVHAEHMGFAPVQGTEVVHTLLNERVIYAEVHALPFGDDAFDVVTMFDVIEHLIPGDDERACRELACVARRHILVSANNRPSLEPDGSDLHINKRPYEEWDTLFRAWFGPATVTWLKGHRYVSETWQIDL